MVSNDKQWLRIGDVAQRAGVSVETIRYYERRGLLPPPQRLPSGYRLYDEPTVARIHLARRLQSLGMTLEEIAAALTSHDGLGSTCETERWRLESVRDRLDAKIADMTAVRESLGTVLRHCATGYCNL